MSIIDLALIGKLKKTKADKSNVLQLDNAGAYTPSGLYNPTTKKYVDDNVQANKLKSISDTPVIKLLDQKTNTTANDLSSYIGAASSLYAKNYDYSLFLQNQNMVFNESNLTTPLTVECWLYYLDDSASSTRIFEVGGTIPGDKAQWVELNANGSIGFTDTTGTVGGNTGGSFTPYANWVHYAMYVSQTEWCVWINGVRRSYGNFSVDVTGDYRQTVPRTYVSLGSYFSTAPAFVQPFSLYDSVRVSSGDRYGKSNASITIPQLFDADASTTHLYHVDASYDANVANNLYVNTPTEGHHAASKLYVDQLVASIPVVIDTDTFTSGGYVSGNTLILSQNNGGTVNIDVSSLLDDTTNTITSGVLNGNSILFTRQDGSDFTVDVSNLYDDTNLVTAVNGQTGSVTVPLLSSVSFNSSTKVLTTNRSDGVSYTADLSELARNDYVDSATLSGTILTLGRTGILADLTVELSSLVKSNTDEITEGSSHLYFTNNRARSAISVAGPQTQLSYNNGTGVFTFVPTDISGKQDVLVSGTSIKSINGISLLGAGDIAITANGIDTYVTSGTISGSTLTLTHNTGSTVSINVGALLDDTTNTVSSGVLSGSVIRFTRQNGTTFDVDVADLYDDTNLVTSVNGQTGAVTVTDTNNYVDSATLNGNVLTLGRTGGLSNVTVDLSALKTTDTDNYVDSATLNGNVLTLGRSGSLADLTVDLSTLHGVDTDNYVDSVSLNGNILTLGRSGALADLTVDLGSLNTGGGTSNINVFSRREKQDFTAQAGQTQFVTTLDLIDVEVFFNGIKLDEEDFVINGHTVTLLEAAEFGDNIEVIDYGSQDLTGETFVTSNVAPSAPAIGTVWQDTITATPIIKIWNGSQWTIIGNVDAAYSKHPFNITTSTSSFAVHYTVGLVEVFFNGLKLADNEFTATNGTSVELQLPAENGDYVEIIALAPLTSGLFYNKTEVNALLANIDLSNYYTKSEVDQMIAGAGTGSADTSGLTTQVIDTFSTNDYRSGEYLLLVTGTSGFMTLKMIVLFNGTVALNSQYGQLGDDLGSFDTLVSGSNVQVVFTPIDASAKVQFTRTMIAMTGTTPPTSLPSDLNSGSGTVDLNSGTGTIDLNGTSVSGDLMSGSGTIDLMSGSGVSDMNV
jgi:hypothetical protein